MGWAVGVGGQWVYEDESVGGHRAWVVACAWVSSGWVLVGMIVQAVWTGSMCGWVLGNG